MSKINAEIDSVEKRWSRWAKLELSTSWDEVFYPSALSLSSNGELNNCSRDPRLICSDKLKFNDRWQ